MKKPVKGHHGHAYCGGLCVPHWLNEQFSEQLGAKASEFDLLLWYVERDKRRKLEGTVTEEPLTFWREEFRTELAFRGWLKPKWTPKPALPPIQAERLQRLGHTMGRTREETEKHFEQYRAYKNTHHNSE